MTGNHVDDLHVGAAPGFGHSIDPADIVLDASRGHLERTLDLLADDGIAIDRQPIAVLRSDDISVVYRMRTTGSGQSVLIALSATDRPAPEFNRRVEQVFALRGWLDASFALVPRQLLRVSGALAMVLEDTGGNELRRIMGQPMALGRFLTLAPEALEAVARMHAHEVIHRDLRPANLLHDDDGHVSLTGFGNSARIGPEPSSHEGASVSPDSWPYMSPEQTGRMSRPVDSRSDLYSIGVIFYEMLTGALPFMADDALEWAHRHIAGTPASPSDTIPTVPRQLSRMVLRLLCKTPEARYQTAAGAARDFRRCQAQWTSTGAIDEFPMGAHDLPDQLIVAGHLYGRDVEVASLLAAYARVVDRGRPELVLVAGLSGVGKSSVAAALQTAIVQRRGAFACGKFEQHKGEIPYATLAQALKSLTCTLLGLDDAGVARWRARLLEALGNNGRLIIGLVPELELIIGKQPPLEDMPASEAANRFHVTVRRFLGAFASAQRPLALFIDDLQWLDAATLDLIRHLLTAQEEQHLLLIGAYRDTEVDAAHPLPAMRDHVLAAGVPVLELKLGPLRVEDVRRLVADTLREEGPRVEALASLIHHKTRGNPFFAIQFFTELGTQRFLRFNRATPGWEWDLASIEARGYSDNVADLMLERLQRLPERTRVLVQMMACLGATATLETMAVIAGQPAIDVDAQLALAERAGLLSRRATTYRFLHDRIQEAAYALINQQERAAVHLEIARRLDSRAAERVEVGLFDVVNQFGRGAELITQDDERVHVALLNLRAAARAKADTAYTAALAYLRGGEELISQVLDPDWTLHYRLRFDLSRASAECELLTGQLHTAQETLKSLMPRATGAVDRGSVAALRVTVYLALDESALAIDTGLAYLREDGSDWPRHPNRSEVTSEYASLLAGVTEGAVHSLVDLLPLMDPRRHAVLDVLTELLPPAFFSDENLVCLLLCRMAQLSVRHGNAHASPLAYAYLGMMVGPYFGDYSTAFEFGKLGLAIVDRGDLPRYRGRVYMCFGAHVAPWAQPIRSAQPFIREALVASRERGDITYTGFSACTLVTNQLGSGEHLDDVARDATSGLAFVTAAKFGLIVDIITTQRQLVRSLQGQTLEFGSLDDLEFNEVQFEAHLRANRSLDIAACWYWTRKAQARFMAGDTTSALEAILQAAPLLWTSLGHFEFAEYHFVAGLVRAACAEAADPSARQAHQEALAGHRAQIELWAMHCASNFAARASLLAAESARLDGDVLAAMGHCEAAVSQAQKNHFVHDEALALELFARLHDNRGLRSAANALLREARDRYAQWGALGKVRQLERQHALSNRDTPPSNDGLGTRTGSFDIAAVVRTSQAIAGEVGLERLMRTVMRIALAHSGAERGVLIRPRGEALRIEARAWTRDDDVEVDLRSLPISPAELPVSMIHYAIRTRNVVMVEDAQQAQTFAGDPYLADRQCRSLLCVPLVKQTELIGLLYLENGLASHVFTPERIAVLTLLASTVAMSMDNASLEEKESLLQEVHHRVKNNLQLISSLLSLQAMRVADPAVASLFSDSCNRLRSMALVHENLYRAGNFARVPMAAHIQNLCTQLMRAYGMPADRIALEVNADDLHLDLNRAVSCGLIVNELVSNALKHAFAPGQAGTITVNLRAFEDARCELSVSDDGRGLPAGIDVRNASTLGLQLVGDLAEQLHGRLSASRDAGTSWCIAFEADVVPSES